MLLSFGEYSLEPVRRELRRGDVLLTITSQQLDLLICFVASRGRLLSKQDLLDQVWDGHVVAENVISVAVAKLRKLLGRRDDGGEYVVNQYGRGYRFLAPVSLAATPTAQASPGQPALGQTERPKGQILVGRVESTQRLESALSHTLSGHGGLCVLTGEAGSARHASPSSCI